jgi:hypothetical protein
MTLPAFRLHQIYSIAFSTELDVLIANLSSIDLKTLKIALDSKQSSGMLHIVPHRLSVDLGKNSICITGYQIAPGRYIVGDAAAHEIFILPLAVSSEQLRTTLEYVYHTCGDMMKI